MENSRLISTRHERPAVDLMVAARSASFRVIAWFFVAVIGVVLLMATVTVPRTVIWSPVSASLGFSLVVGSIWAVVVSIVSFFSVRDQRVIMEREYYPLDVSLGPVRLEHRVDNKIVMGRYEFSKLELSSLAEALDKHGWKFTRDVVRSSGVFSGLSKSENWSRVRGDFDRLGFVGADNIVPPERRYDLAMYSPTLAYKLRPLLESEAGGGEAANV